MEEKNSGKCSCCAHAHEEKHGCGCKHEHESLKEKAVLIAVTTLLLIGAVCVEKFCNLATWQSLIVYLIPYLVIGHDTLKEAWEGTPMTKAEKQWEDAVEQIKHYAEAPRVEALRQGTTLHKIIMQFKGWELSRMEEV